MAILWNQPRERSYPMMLTTRGRYAIMAMLHMMLEAEEASPVTLACIAQTQGIPLNYLEQIFLRLRRKGLVVSVRGAKGGYRLVPHTRELSLLDIMQAAEESIIMTRCHGHSEGCLPSKSRCATHHLWQGLEDHIGQYFRSKTLQELAHPGGIQEDSRS